MVPGCKSHGPTLIRAEGAFGTREKLPTPTRQKLTSKAALALQLLRLTATRHSRVE